VKRFVLLVSLAACLSKGPMSPAAQRAHDRLGNVTVESHLDRHPPTYEAYRDERMDFELDAAGNLTRTSIEIPRDALPASVLAAVPLRRIADAFVIFEKGTVTFRLSNGDDEFWSVDVSGKILSYDFQGDDCCDD
jgi:hypothetical protein